MPQLTMHRLNQILEIYLVLWKSLGEDCLKRLFVTNRKSKNGFVIVYVEGNQFLNKFFNPSSLAKEFLTE